MMTVEMNDGHHGDNDDVIENNGPSALEDSKFEIIGSHFSNGESGGGGKDNNCHYDNDDDDENNDHNVDNDGPTCYTNLKTETMCSVLNVVIDHTMESITPLEDEEWRHRQQQQQKQKYHKQKQKRPSSSDPSLLSNKNLTIKTTSIEGGEDDDDDSYDDDDRNDQLQVPVIRIFGPLLRDPHQIPVQSACLYIHGAFPYLLARPVVAGPDGSLRRAGRHSEMMGSSSSSSSSSSFVDWDDVADVEKIQIDIHRIVEETAQSLDFGFGGGGGGDNNNINNNGNDRNFNGLGGGKNKVRHPIIRKVTVVEGRGFYSYCPGPSAPFLKIEYYDPKLRWKVKLVLERGLEVPLRYHPDPRQYDREDIEENGISGGPPTGHHHRRRHQPTSTIDDNLLKFHCYEAHIPYTMQFFKDHNLAGMSYVHLRKGRIRGRLAERYTPSIKQDRIPLDSNGMDDIEALNRSVFIRPNTPREYLWSTYVDEGRGVSSSSEPRLIPSILHPRTHDDSPRDTSIGAPKIDDDRIIHDHFIPPSKNTSCDVELDCTVQDIRNVEAVMTTMPTDQDERDRIQWRAVPSLQEIWREERRRMDRLLSPQLTQHVMDDVLSPKVGLGQPPVIENQQQPPPPPPFTLNVKKDAPRSGGRLAARGMWSLVAVTAGLQQDFVRALSDILRRHQQAVEEVDDELRRRSTTTKARKSSTTSKDGTSTACKGQTKFQFSSPATPSFSGSVPSNGDTSTPSFIDAIAALETLGSATPGSTQDDYARAPQTDQDRNTPSIDEAILALESLADSIPEGINSLSESTPGFTPSPATEHASQPTDGWVGGKKGRDGSLIPTPLSQSEVLSSQRLSQPLSYQSSQELDDGIMSMHHVDPIECSQRIDRGDAVLEFQDRDVEDLIDPETLAPYDHIDFDESRCRAIFVVERDRPHMQRLCGLPGGSCSRDGHFYAEERAKPGIYRTVTTGAVVDGLIESSKGMFEDEDGGDNDIEEYCRSSQPDYGGKFDLATQPTQTRQMTGSVGQPLSQRLCELKEIEDLEETILSGEEDDGETVANLKREKKMGNTPEMSPIATTGQIAELLESYVEPPNRGLVSTLRDSSKLLAPSERDTIPEWLSHAAAYARLKSSKSSTANARRKSRGLPRSNVIIQPTIIAPSRKTVESWTQQKSKDEVSTKFGPPKKRMKQTRVDAGRPRTMKQQDRDLLEIDSNSRKLVPIAGNKTTGSESDILNQQHGIEEVVWESSQKDQMTPTQFSQNEMDVGEQTGEKGKSTGNILLDESTPASVERSEGSRSLTMLSESQVDSVDPLIGIGNQGGRIHVEGGGGLKAKTKLTQLSQGRLIPENENSNYGDRNTFLPCPISIMSVEIHVQCREGTSRLDSKKISMAQNSSKDKISAIVFVYARDPGGGESLDILSRGCICTTLDGENPTKDSKINRDVQHQLLRSIPRSTMGVASQLLVEVVENERHLLRRFKDIVRLKDPDMLISWDTQGAGLGYMIERGFALRNSDRNGATSGVESGSVDMAKLLGRTPTDKKATKVVVSIPGDKEDGKTFPHDNSEHKWTGSGLGSDWDDRVGAGAAAASIVGRLVFSGWKLVSEEVKHANANYLPAIFAAVLNKRIPYHDDMTLTNWYAHSSERWRVLSHRLTQATATLLLFDALDIVGRAGEAARLSGVEFSQSFPGIRGSQYKVEGVLLRALQSLRSDERGSKKGQQVKGASSSQHSGSSSATTRSQTQSPWKLRRRISESSNLNGRQYFFFSPSLQDTNKQEALEVQAMTLEPQSGHYSDPVVVCDFTALYPSLIIAYNLCYSTCAGKLDYHSTRREMRMEGKTRGRVGPIHYPERRTATVLKHHMKSIADGAAATNVEDICNSDFLGDRVYVAPTGTIYLSESVLKGVLPQVLDEILTTRAMLKRAAKEYVKGVKNLSPAILRQLEARQLALKYVANVTYGYTSATFSGRCAMPLLADAIVECGRRTLRRAMDIANRWGQGTDPWGRLDDSWLGARVIYGDTDSLFIKMPGRSYKEAFEFGEKLCAAVTSLNPPPVQLKLEKVYLGSIMQTMKRYCGMKFESKDQKKPVFEAKGLETIRRDQCALTQKVLRNALITLFKHGVVAVKEYLYRQWYLIFAGQLPVSDFILTGKVRSKYRGGKEGPVQAVLARRLGEADPGRIVRHKERLPYVIVATPGMTFRLKDCVLTPMELLERWDAYKIHSAYYIERHVNAALQRCLGLAPHFVNVADWFRSCPRPRRRTHFWPVKSKRAMITAYFGNDICSLCQRKCQADGSNPVVVCKVCRRDKVRSIQVAAKRLNDIQDEANALGKECSRCNGCFEDAYTFAVVQPPKLPANESEEQHKKKGSSSLFGKSSKSSSNNNKDTLLLPLANCVCIDCPVTFRRHRLREQGIEAEGTYIALSPSEYGDKCSKE